MPSLASRLMPLAPVDQHIDFRPGMSWTAPSEGPDSLLSPMGNPAPNRGLIPPEFMYDFQTNLFYPDRPQFVRGSVDVITPVRNLVLQAANASGVKVAQ